MKARKTINIPADLHNALKIRAATSGISLEALVAILLEPAVRSNIARARLHRWAGKPKYDRTPTAASVRPRDTEE
jgi:plasmid stability protein